jgi:CheY-like chemotaxis protein
LVRTLLVSGARCSAAADADTALKMLQSAAETDPYHALVTTAVPGSAILAAEAGTESVPVLLITPSFQPEWEGRCAAHLTPPVRREALILALNAAAPQAAAPVTRTSETVDEPPPVRGRVLVAEDNPANQRVARFQLEHLGMRVDIVADGRQALHLLEQTDHSYDLALMDCQMPEMDGYEATRAIRTAEGATQRHIPIIAMTAGALKRDLDACIEAGMDDYITKPVIVETLRTVLDRWLVPAPMRDTSAPD